MSCSNVLIMLSGGPRWLWGGCSDNIAFGNKISKIFIDSLELGKDARAAVILHNNGAGRKVRFVLFKILN